MKPKKQTLILIGVAVACAVVIIILSGSYFQYISNQLFEHATEHLKEVYDQVDHSFLSFMDVNWGYLRDWDAQIEGEDQDLARSQIDRHKEHWGFSEFYFIADDGRYVTASGQSGNFDLGENAALLSQDTDVMFNATTPLGQNVTLFAVPAQGGVWDGLNYSAIAISYTNADMVEALNVDAFSNESSCFIVEQDGSVLLSTMPGGSVFKNYIAYLDGASDLSDSRVEQVRADWEQGKSGALRAVIGGVEYYVYYERSGYLDTMLIGVVPSEAAGANLIKIQTATIDVFVKITLLICLPVILWIIVSYRAKTKKGAVELMYREKMFDVLSKNINDIFLMLDAKNFHVDYLSPNVEKLLGIPHDLAEEDPRLIIESMSKGADFINSEELAKIPMDGKKRWECEHTNRSTGEKMWFLDTVYHENIEGTEKYLIVMSDRTYEQSLNKQLQEALEAAKNANEAKSHFLANMSHDIRTPMNAIIGFSNLLAKDADDPEKVRSYIRKISASSHHLLSLINDVLDMSKIESGKTSLNNSEFVLPEVLEELYTIIHPQAKAKEQTFNIFVKDRPTERLIGDVLRLDQILVNLLSNAVKYTQNGGTIDLFVQEMPQPSPQFVKLKFVVQDNGMGMSQDYLKKIFDPFTREVNSMTNKIQGTGLGMAITKNLISLMGGTIDVKSAPGEGTTFTVELLFTPASPDEDREFWTNNNVKRVLVADDEPEVCKNIAEIMSEVGVETVSAASGEEALAVAKAEKDKGEDFDAYIIDLRMPGINGTETAKKLRELTGTHSPVVLFTAYDRSEVEKEAREAGIDLFITKPFFLTSFRQALESYYAARSLDIDDDEEALAGMRFLVAEDNDLNAEVLFETLEIEGAELERAENGKIAVDMFEESQPGYYDMILMDVQMPEMNGYEATRAIRALDHPRAHNIPIIAMTANAFAEDIQEALNSGMDAHIAKPIYLDTLLTLINNIKKSQGLNN